MILYFTGTGNSKFVAEYLADKLQDEVVSLNKILKNGENLVCNSEKPYIVVAPIYAWRFPAVVEELLKKSCLKGNKTVYCIGTMGENSGSAGSYLKKIFTAKGMTFTGFTGVVMQNNYLFMEKMPKPREALRKLGNCVPKLDKIVAEIAEGKTLKKDDKTAFAPFMSSVVNAGFNKFMVKKQTYTVDRDCISCGKCVSVCPVNNIKMKNRKPVFDKSCTGCLACLHHCPKQAINVRNDTQDKGRYICPEYKHWKRKNN